MRWWQPPLIHRSSPGGCWTGKVGPICTASRSRVTCVDCICDQFGEDYRGVEVGELVRMYAYRQYRARIAHLERRAARGFWATLLAWDHFMVTSAKYAMPLPPRIL